MDNKRPFRTTRRRQRWPREVEDELWRLLHEHRDWSPKQVRSKLCEKFDLSDVPTEKTIKRRRAEGEGRDTSGLWTVRDAESPEEARLILPVLRYVVWITDGEIKSLTAAQARWIARIMVMRPDFQAYRDAALSVFLLATDYAERQQAGEDASDLDYFLALIPPLDDPGWLREDLARNYRELVKQGAIPEARHARDSSDRALLNLGLKAGMFQVEHGDTNQEGDCNEPTN